MSDFFTWPVVLEVALHYHVYVTDHPRLKESESVAKAAQLLAREGLLHYKEGAEIEYVATDALKIYIDALCSVPFPVRGWVMPRYGNHG